MLTLKFNFMALFELFSDLSMAVLMKIWIKFVVCVHEIGTYNVQTYFEKKLCQKLQVQLVLEFSTKWHSSIYVPIP